MRQLTSAKFDVWSFEQISYFLRANIRKLFYRAHHYDNLMYTREMGVIYSIVSGAKANKRKKTNEQPSTISNKKSSSPSGTAGSSGSHSGRQPHPTDSSNISKHTFAMASLACAGARSALDDLRVELLPFDLQTTSTI